jgi:small-conductance mechanosensitive channel
VNPTSIKTLKTASTGFMPRLGRKNNAMCGIGIYVLIGIGVFLFLTIGVLQAEEQPVKNEKTEIEPKAPEPIAMGNVATLSTEVFDLLQTLNTQFEISSEIQKTQEELPEITRRMEMELERTRETLENRPSLEKLQTEGKLWQKHQNDMEKRLTLYTERTTQMRAALNQLADLQNQWGHTLESARATQAPETIFQQISTTLSALEKTRSTLENRRNALIDLQSRFAEVLTQCRSILTRISQAQQMTVARIATRERLPIWSLDLWVVGYDEEYARIREIASDQWADIKAYLFNSSHGMPLHLLLFLFLSALFLAMRRQERQWASDDKLEVISIVIGRPYNAALIVCLFLAASPFSRAPTTVRYLFGALVMLPMIRLVKPMVSPKLVLGLYVLSFLFIVDVARHAVAAATLFDRTMILVEILGGMAVFGWEYGYLRRTSVKATGSGWIRLIRQGLSFSLAILIAGLGANVFGYRHIAGVLVSGVLIGSTMALILFTSVKILSALTAFLLRLPPMRNLLMVHHHRSLLESRIFKFLVGVAVISWLVRLLDYVGFVQPVLLFGKAVLAAKIEQGTVSLSLGGVLSFILVFWLAHLLSGLVCFVLQEDVYPRRKVPEGTAFATFRLIRYSLFTVGFIIGMGLLGVELSKVMVLIGAFGVGIGFGLQNIVNNFVSGLVLLFERPLRVNDTVELGSLRGVVKRIGLRSSVVRTNQGAEIIVPNAQLVSEQVVNWTLSDRNHRLELSIGVNYGANPEDVIQVLEKAATSHPRILKNPPPKALFIEFGENSMNFELQIWSNRFLDWTQIKSELGVTVYHAIHAAGMSFPFPQREVRLIGAG